MDVNSQDVQDIISLQSYKASTTLRISTPFESLPRLHYSLFSVSNLFGWAAFVVKSSNSSSPSSLGLSRLDHLQAAFNQAEPYSTPLFLDNPSQVLEIPITSLDSLSSLFITHIAFASWDRLIIVATSDGSLHIFSLYALVHQKSKVPIKSIPSANSVPLRMLVPNPSHGGDLAGVIAVVYQDGTIRILDSYQINQTYWIAQHATVAEWSPLGKRLLVGYTDGRLEFVTHEGVSKGKIDPPALVKDKGLSVLHIKWLDQKNYLITFIQPLDVPDFMTETFCLHVPRQADPSTCTFSRVVDAITSDDTSSVLPNLLTLTLPVNPLTNWKHLTISSFTLSTTLTLIGYTSSDQPFSLNLGEDARPEIPASEEDYSPTSTLGLGASYCAHQKLPLIWCLTTDGVLALWKVRLVPPSSELNPSQVWNEITAYSDIVTVEEKGLEGPPMPAAVVSSAVDKASTAQPQVGLVSASSPFAASGTLSAPIASAQVTAFGKPSLSSTGFGTPPALNQSGFSSIAFGKSSLGSSPSPFANSLPGPPSVGFSGFASASSLKHALGNSTPSANTNGGFAAFSNIGSTAGFAAFSNSSDNSETGLASFANSSDKPASGFASFSQSSGFASFANSSDKPASGFASFSKSSGFASFADSSGKPQASGFASFANSSDKAGLASSSVSEQFTAAGSQPPFFGGSTTTKATSIFDNPPISQEFETVDSAKKETFGITQSSDSSVLTTKSLIQTNVSFEALQNSSTVQSHASSHDVNDQRHADTKSIASGPSLPSSAYDSTAKAQPAKQPSPSFDISSHSPSTNAETPDRLSSENQKPDDVADDKGNQHCSEDESVTSGSRLPSSTRDLIEGAETNKPPSAGFDMSSLGLSINSNTARDLVDDDEDHHSASDHTPSISISNSMDESSPTKTSSPSRDISAARPPLNVHVSDMAASIPISMSSISFGFGGRTLPNPMRPSPLGSASPQGTPSCDVAPSKSPVSPRPLLEGTPCQATDNTQPGSFTVAGSEPNALADAYDKPRAIDILSDLQNEPSVTSPSPDECPTVEQALSVESTDDQVDCADSEHLDNTDIQSENEVDVSSESDNDLSENIDDELAQSDDAGSLESEDDNHAGSKDVSDKGEEHDLVNVASIEPMNVNLKGEVIQKHEPHDQLETGLGSQPKASPSHREEEQGHRPIHHISGTPTRLDDTSDTSTSPKSLFGLTSSPPSKLRRSLTSNRETLSHPALSNTRPVASADKRTSGLPFETTITSYPPDSHTATASLKNFPVHQTAPYVSQSTPSIQRAVSTTKSPASHSLNTSSLPRPFLVTQPEFTTPVTFLSSEMVPKIYVNTSSESFSKLDEGLDLALSKFMDLISSEIECLASVSLVCRQHLSECCKKLPPNTAVTMQGVPPNLLFGDLPVVFQHVQSLIQLAKRKEKENEARLQAVTVLDNAHIKVDMKVEEIKRILRLRNDPGFSQVIRTRQLGPVQLAHQKDMRRMIRDVKHGISQMTEVLQSFESQHRKASTCKNRIQTPSLDTINRCIRFITLGLTHHMINLEKLHLQVSQQKARTCALKDKKELLGVNSLSSGSPSHIPDQAALTALMSEHRGAILKESILKRGDGPILTRAQTILPTNSSAEPSGLSHIRTRGVINISPRD